jgi:DNA polymerase-3 subunit epsilon
MDDARRQRFTRVVHEEAERLAAQLAAALAEPDAARRGGWPVEDVQVGDLVFALQHGLRAGPGIECGFDGAGAARWLEVDSHALVQALAHAIARLAADVGAHEVALAVREDERLVRLDIEWRGERLDALRLRDWQAEVLGPASALREVLDRHGAECWVQRLDDEGRGRLCVQLLAAPGVPLAAREALRGRPISYDFDLFNQGGQNAALDDTPLAALTCTVFDTETTGLRPSEGDEIIAVGAVRIVNARLLEHEAFDRRVRPRRAVRASAQAVHGISTEQLAGEPPLEQVLPAFARFCEDTVLVAHNAAFDMRLLELARERTGLVFDQPVLDTLLLAAVVQPGHRGDEHHLEQIAARLGVEVVGRHQALGDAIVTGRVFLKLLPLLAECGIVTLGQARAASQRTAQARESF